MAQLVKLEPGDVLVLANVGDDVLDEPEHLEWLKEHLQLDTIFVFAGDVDLSKLPPDAS
jgi:hypothetical protein